MAHMAGFDHESKLTEQSLSGDPEAYGAMVNQHQKMIRALARSMRRQGLQCCDNRKPMESDGRKIICVAEKKAGQ